MTSDTVDYFMSLANGANYVVLYQLLCLKTINTNGRLSRQIGEIIIPYDVEKIQRDTKWFTTETVRAALELYKKFGLIYEDIDGVLALADHYNLVGSETDYAAQKKQQRALAKSQNVQMEHTDTAALSACSIPCPFDEIQRLWNDICVSLPHVDSIQHERRKLVQERWNEYPSLDRFEMVFRNVEASEFLKGANKKHWIIQFNWLMKDDHFTKVLEGNYNTSKTNPDTSSSISTDDIMEELRKQYADGGGSPEH